MKTYLGGFLVFLLIFVVFGTEEETRNEIFSFCLTSTGYKGELDFDLQKEVSKEAKCFVSCVATKQGLQYKDGKVNHDLLIEAMDQMENKEMVAKYKAALKECDTEAAVQGEECDVIFQHVRCWERKMDALNQTATQ